VTNGPEQSQVPAASPDRRLSYRRTPASLAYVEMGEDNGGIILNLSEGGLALQTVVAVTDEHLSRLRFQLSSACDWVNASGRVVWNGESKKVAGIRFLNLPETVRVRIRNWISLEGSDQEFGEKPASLRENGKPFPERPPNRDSQALKQVILQKAQNEDFWAPYPPRIPPGVLREATPAELQTSAPLRPSALARPSVQTTCSGKSKKRWKIGALFSFTAAVSLAVGICIGNGSLDPWFRKSEESKHSTRTIEPAAAYTNAKGSSPPAPAPDGLTSGVIETQLPSQTANLLTLPADELQSGVWISAPESGEPSLRLNMPPEAVSASSSIAIVSQRSLVVPPISREGTLQRTERLRVGDLMTFTEPIYPAEARRNKTADTVELRATVSPEGEVRYVALVIGSPLLAQAAIDAISGWRYEPTLLDGQAIETEDDITMEFRRP
jgi:periplasmic protein TonB